MAARRILGQDEQLTSTNAVTVEPRYSPDGKQLAYVSTAATGHFELFVAPFDEQGRLGAPRPVVAPRESKIARYYYSKHDHTINPRGHRTASGWCSCRIARSHTAPATCAALRSTTRATSNASCTKTSWRARPQVAPDGRRVLYSSYERRQSHQLWLTTLAGDAPLPLTFGDFDATAARWSPDGRRIAYVSNEDGNLGLRLLEVVGGQRTPVVARERKYARPMATLKIQLAAASRVSVVGSDNRYYGPDDRWIHADDGFDPVRVPAEVRYFHCPGECAVTVPLGEAYVTAWRGVEYTPVRQTVDARADGVVVNLSPAPLKLPDWAPRSVSADLHVHMNYGGHYRNTEENLIEQARAEDLDVVYNLIVNKEQRIPDIARFDPGARRVAPSGRAIEDASGVTLFRNQEYHTSFWGHLGLLHTQRYLTPDFSAYLFSALTSPYPTNGVIADLTHEQGGFVGYVHPFDSFPDPERESLTNAFPVDVALGKVDYVEIVGFPTTSPRRLSGTSC